MKFKIQKCQTDAVEASADVFAGKPNRTARYTRDLGRHRDMQKPTAYMCSMRSTSYRQRLVKKIESRASKCAAPLSTSTRYGKITALFGDPAGRTGGWLLVI